MFIDQHRRAQFRDLEERDWWGRELKQMRWGTHRYRGWSAWNWNLKPMRERLKIEIGIHEFEFEIEEKEKWDGEYDRNVWGWGWNRGDQLKLNDL